LITKYDPLAMIRIGSGEQLRIARKVAFDLARFGSFCALHAALLPDTPGLAALRQTVVYWGIDRMLISISRSIRTATGFAFTVVSGLHPIYWTVHRVLCAQVEAGPPLLPDTEDGLRDYLAGWAAAVQAARRYRSRWSRSWSRLAVNRTGAVGRSRPPPAGCTP